MSSKLDNSSTFRTIAAFAVFLLIGAAALVYLQSGGRNPATPKLAALSQAIPTQAARALSGESGAFEQLELSINQVASLRRGGGVPGKSSDWQQLESHASAILAERSAVEGVRGALRRIDTDAASIVELSNELLDRSGATATIQEFQQRANRIRQSALALPAGGQGVASAIAEDIGFLRNVANALQGEPSDLDVRPLNQEGQDVVLVPVMSSLTSLEGQSETLNGSIDEVADLAAAEAALGASASQLLGSAFGVGGSSTSLPAFLERELDSYWHAGPRGIAARRIDAATFKKRRI